MANEFVDPQGRLASRTRFAIADGVTLARPGDVEAHVRITSRTVALLMSHNYSQDVAFLRFLLASPARYIGVMGPRQRTERMLCELSATGAAGRLHVPVGLDIGANGPAEIALSIVAEMRAVLDGHGGGMLRDREGSIHETREERLVAVVRREDAPGGGSSRPTSAGARTSASDCHGSVLHSLNSATEPVSAAGRMRGVATQAMRCHR